MQQPGGNARANPLRRTFTSLALKTLADIGRDGATPWAQFAKAGSRSVIIAWKVTVNEIILFLILLSKLKIKGVVYMLWRIYFFVYSAGILISVGSNIIEGKMDYANIVDTLFCIIGFIAFFNFVFTKRKAFIEFFWKLFFFIVITWDILFSFVIFPANYEGRYYYAVAIDFLFLIPLYYSYYYYAFKMKC